MSTWYGIHVGLDESLRSLARRFPGAVVRRVDRDKQSKSPMTTIVGAPVYQEMATRNINTARKLVELADTDASA